MRARRRRRRRNPSAEQWGVLGSLAFIGYALFKSPAPAPGSTPAPPATNDGGGWTWSLVQPSGSSYAVGEGQRYAVLASVSASITLAKVQSYLASHGWTVTYAWEYGTPSRGLYDVDAYLDALPADPNTSHRWVYGEVDRTDVATSLGVSAPWPFTFYEIAWVKEAIQAAA